MALTCQKHLFRLDPELHYLNCAFMAPLPRAVEAAGLDGLALKRTPSSIAPAMIAELNGTERC